MTQELEDFIERHKFNRRAKVRFWTVNDQKIEAHTLRDAQQAVMIYDWIKNKAKLAAVIALFPVYCLTGQVVEVKIREYAFPLRLTLPRDGSNYFISIQRSQQVGRILYSLKANPIRFTNTPVQIVSNVALPKPWWSNLKYASNTTLISWAPVPNAQEYILFISWVPDARKAYLLAKTRKTSFHDLRIVPSVYYGICAYSTIYSGTGWPTKNILWRRVPL